MYQYLFKKNINWSDPKKITFFEYLYVFVLIIYAGKANTFVVSTSLITNPVGVSLIVVISGILAIRGNIIFNKNFYLLICCFFIYFIAISIKYSEIHPTIFLDYFLLFFIAYVTIKALEFNLFKIYEYVLYYLAIIGLLMWGIQIILGGDTLYYYFSKISLLKSTSFVSLDGLNAIIYSVMPSSESLYNFTIPRNCGFAWEPGGFAVYLCLAIFINLFIPNADSKGKIRFWVLFFALISTQSTTGFTIFTIIILFYYLNKKRIIIFLLLPVMVTALILIFSLPFMSNKIVSVVNETSEIDLIVERSIGTETPIEPQRFASFMIAIKDFRNNPILGNGNITGESWTSKIGANVSAISGIGNLLSDFGIIGFLFFIIYSIKSSFFLSKYYDYKGKYLLFLIILLISISYGVILLPLGMSFWMFQLFIPKTSSKIDLYQNPKNESFE